MPITSNSQCQAVRNDVSLASCCPIQTRAPERPCCKRTTRAWKPDLLHAMPGIYLVEMTGRKCREMKAITEQWLLNRSKPLIPTHPGSLDHTTPK